MIYGFPIDEYLRRGISASDARALLESHDALTFPQLASGLFPAMNPVDDATGIDPTGMTDAWLRDTACIALALLADGQHIPVKKAVDGIVSRLTATHHFFEAIIDAGHPPLSDTQRPPVRFTGDASIPQDEWANAQNDALGYSLLAIGRSCEKGATQCTREYRATIDTLLRYLAAIQYWQDADSGHWEEIKKVNSSSIGAVVAGLKAVQPLTGQAELCDTLIQKGERALSEILPFESRTKGFERSVDAAQLFLVEPLGVVSRAIAATIVAQVEKHLQGERGIRRYRGDSYWGPNYRDHFQLRARTADFSRPEIMALRNGYLTPNDEAQWTLFDPVLAVYYARQFQLSQKASDARAANRYIVRALRGVVAYKRGKNIVWRLPELFFHEKGELVPDDHPGLLWAQANLLQALIVHEGVFGTAHLSELA